MLESRPWLSAAIGGAFVALLAPLSLLPARILEFSYLSFQGYGFFDYVLAAFGRDAASLTPLIFGTWFLTSALATIAARLLGQPGHSLFPKIVLSLVILFLIVCGIGAVQFRIERGVYPSLFDVKAGRGGGAILMDYAVILLRKEILLGIAVFASVVWGFLRLFRLRGYSLFNLDLRNAGILPLATVVTTAGLFQLWANAPRLFTSIVAREELAEPFSHLTIPFGRNQLQVIRGFASVFENKKFPPELNEHGMQMMGFKAVNLDLASCSEHPFASPLPGTLASLALRQDISKDSHQELPNFSYATRLEDNLTEVSNALFATEKKPVQIWHFLLESYAADDIHAINSYADPGVAPFWNYLYRDAESEAPVTIASKTMYQAGIRTSQGIAATSCGMGTMPFNISFSRDLGNVPFRCLADVLADAGFITNQYVGSDPKFDNMEAFFNFHRLKLWHMFNFPNAREHIDNYSHGDRAITDLHLAHTAFIKTRNLGAVPAYVSMLTINGHGPYWVPKDYPPEARAEIEKIISRIKPFLTIQNDDDRVRVTHYVDHVIKTTVESVMKSKLGTDTIPIFVFSGDHSITEQHVFSRFLGESDPILRTRRFAGIPFALHIPRDVINSLPDPQAFTNAVKEVNRQLAEQPVSQNDIPRLILNVLASSREIKNLPPHRSWHSLGGQATSPFSRSPLKDGDGVVWGIDALTDVFVVNKERKPIFLAKGAWISVPEDLDKPDPLKPMAAAMTTFMRNYSTTCRMQVRAKASGKDRT